MFNPKMTLSRFLWRYLKFRAMYLMILFVVTIIWSIEVFLNPYLLKVIIDTINQLQNDKETLANTLIMPIIFYVSISIISNINLRVYDLVCLRLYPKLKAEIMQDIYYYLIKHSYSFFQSRSAGSLAKRIFDITTSIESILRLIMDSFIPALNAVLISSVMLLIVVHYIFAIILVIWAIFFISFSYLASIKLAYYSQDLSELSAETNGKISESIYAITTLKIFGAHYYEAQSISNSLKCLVDADYKMHWQNLKINFVQGFGITTLTAVMLVSLVYGYLQGLVTVGDFALVLSISISILNSIHNIGHQLQEFAKMTGVCKQALGIIQETHEIIEVQDAETLRVKDGLIEFKNVKFSYSQNKTLFDNFNIKIYPEQKIGFVGHSGGGKSTFIKLILRLIEPQSGSIFIDNQDIKMVTIDSLINHLTVIPQNPEMLNRSVMDNIKFVKPNATDQEVILAAKKARCHKFISELQEGYNTVIGERGTKLSGGQIQRLAIARAFLKNSSILLLDEATSALDSVTEHEIQQSLQELMKGKTTIVIAHRLSTLQKLDRILVLENGKIAEDGDFDTLVNKENGIFFKFLQIQVKGFFS